MFWRDQIRARAGGHRIVFRLLAFVLLLGAVFSAQAADKFCSDAPYFGVIDGNAGYPAPTQITIDVDCTFQNWPQSNPLTTTINFQTNDPTIYLIIFDNVYYTGNMACANIDHRIWFSNSSYYGSNNSCQDLFIPVETIAKLAPATTASVGVPFTYTLTLPSMNLGGGPSANDLHTVVLWDDLTATGVDLTYVGINAYYKGTNTPVTLVPEDNPLSRCGVWTSKNLCYKPIPLINAGEQIVVEITVALDDTATNVAGTQFINTAKWWFGRLIDGVFYEPLPGEWGISAPMTIVEPNLVVNKTSTETALNLGVMAPFTIDVQNTGGSDAWNVTILDQLPDQDPDTGMCDYDPRTGLSARIVAADGTTLVRNLTLGTHYSLNYTGPPTCQLSFTMTTAAGPIGPGQHLIITYQTQLDADTLVTADGIALTNVAGATQWFSSNGTSPPRTYTRTLSDGTPTVVDHQDSQIITTALAGYYFQKTVVNRTSHESPATTAAAGDVLRYKLRLFNISEVINGITISDPLDPTKFDLTTFAMVTDLAAVGATYSFNSTTGQLTISGNGAPLNLAPPAELVIEFDITLKSPLANGTAVLNQASLSANAGTLTADSDDPYVNGIAPPGDPADPTQVVIQSPGPLLKARIQSSATIGQQFRYRITVPAAPTPVPLYDVRILDNLDLSAADMRFVSASVVSGGTWTLSNTSGSNTDLVIEDAATGIDIPANGQVVIDITVELLNTSANNSGLAFINSASYTYNRANGDDTTQKSGGAGSTLNMTVVEPAVTAATKTVSNVTAGKQPTDPAAVGDVLRYVVTIPNSGNSTAFDTNIVDTLPVNVSLVPGSATAQINGVAVTGFIVNPTTLPGGALAWGSRNGDGTLDIPVGQSLVLTYRVTVASVNGLPFNNSVYVDWTSLNSTSTAERTGAGCPTIAAPNDYCYGPVTAAVGTVDTTTIVKSVVSDTYAEVPASTPPAVRIGDTVVYRLALTLREGQLQNVVVTDTLPAGLAFDSVVSINGDTSAPFSATAPFTYTAFTAPAVSGSTVTWSLGDITNAVDNNTANDTFVIEYRARVVNNTLTHTATTTLTNNVALSYTGSDPTAPRLTSSASLTVLQPIMTTPTKSATGFTSPASVNVATDVMPFHLESCNTTGLAPAYSVKFTDQLATQLNETTITTPEVRVGGVLLTAGSDYTYTPPTVRGGTMIFVLNTPVNPGQCATIDYNIGFYTDFGPNQTWTNNVTLDEYWSLQVPTTTGQMYGPLVPTSFTMTNSTTITSPIKTLFSPASNEATIGQEVIYRIAVPGTPTNGAIYNVVITDTLNAALAYVSASDVSGNGFALTDTSVAPSQVTLTIAQIPAGQQAIIELHARVANNTSANAGVSFANSASYTYATSLGGAPISGGSDATDTPLRIVEPNVAVTKSVTPNTPPSAGAILTYTLTLAASGGANFSSAYDVSIVDSLSLGLTYVTNSATVAGTPVNPTITGDGITTPQVLTWNTGFDIPEGTAPVVTYQVQVLAGVGPNQTLRNDVRVAWTGLNGVNVNERTGTGTPAYNDYFATAFTALTTPLPGTLSKQNPATTTVTIGQPFTYRITVPASPMATALHDVRILDNLSATGADLSLVSLAVVGGPYSWTPVNTGTATNLVIEDITNGIDIPAGQQVVIDITVVLNDSPTNASNVQFSNTASYTYNQVANNPATQQPGGSATTANLIIVGPDTLTLDKSGPADMNLGVPDTFTLNVHNAGTGTAWDVTVIDRLPNPTPGGMCDAAPTNVTAQLYLANGTTPVGSPLVAGSDFTFSFAGAPSCTLTINMQSAAGAIPAGYWLRITYQALLDPDNVNGVLLTNVAGATQWYNANPAPGVTPRTYTRVLTNGTVGTLDHEDAHSVNPLIPVSGIVYDSLSREEITGARVTMLRAGVELPASCFDDPAQQNQLTDAYGRYTFELNFSQPACPPGANYVIAITAAPAGYDTSAPSRIIPPTTSAATTPYSVPACPADAIPATTDRCEAQDSPFAPTGAAATTYYLHLTLSNGQIPRDSQIFNNHIPVDPLLDTTLFIDKKSLLINVTRGQLVPYTITVKNRQGGVLQNMAIVDRLPPGFKYVEGSSRYDGIPVKPVIAGTGTELRWENLDLAYNVTHTIKLLLAVSSGVGEGEYVNRAWAHSNLTGEDSGIATATVRVIPDPTFDCTDIIGKVFDDANLNGIQDENENGLPGVRVVSARGLIAKTDAYGRYHVTCAAVPNEARGSNFILKVDDRSLPSGYRLTTKNPLVQRVTRGKAIKFNFGATLHRVVRLDIADGVFEPGSTEMRPQWKPRIGMLLSELRKAPAVLRISYLADVEEPEVVKARAEAVKREIADLWGQGNYQLKIETEIFWWRGGAPARRPMANDGQ
jgi:fimbrial isopeptide formation D2 family protein/uncharacterized repeat protein (TIGR01451 family)